MFAAYFAEPLTDIINTGLRRGEYPKIFKFEYVTPVAKVYPCESVDQLRNISGLLQFDKVMEASISELIISDMKPYKDVSQYGNEKQTSVQHYLIKMIHRILTSVDQNSMKKKLAVIATMIDWKSAFPRQCHKLGIQSFLKNGVRPALIPILINYFQDRKMSVKFHECTSVPKLLNGGGPQGATFGILEYLSQSNNNADCVESENRFKFMDDLTLLEIVNLLVTGMTSYNMKQHVSSIIPVHNQFIDSQNLKSQDYLNAVSAWTKNQKMKINEEKTKTMIFNYTRDHQFTTDLKLNAKSVEVISETKLLGTIITNDLKWDKNTDHIVKKANSRMQLLHKLKQFNAPQDDMKNVYILFIRSILEQSCNVWHKSLSEENSNSLERIQKSACKVILGSKYSGYKEALNQLEIPPLSERRDELFENFTIKNYKNEKLKEFFKPNVKQTHMTLKNPEKFEVSKFNTNRMKYSTIIQMQILLNEMSRKGKL